MKCSKCNSKAIGNVSPPLCERCLDKELEKEAKRRGVKLGGKKWWQDDS